MQQFECLDYVRHNETNELFCVIRTCSIADLNGFYIMCDGEKLHIDYGGKFTKENNVDKCFSEKVFIFIFHLKELVKKQS